MSFFSKIIAFFMAVIAFFSGLFSNGKKPADPTPAQPAQTEFYDQAYGGDARQVFDLVLPENAAGEKGLILFIHGGAWISGNKDQYRGALKTAAGMGYAAAALNYRYLSDTVHMDALMSDVSAALAKIKALAAEWNVQLNRALLTGVSAGAHMSMLYAYKYAEGAPIAPVAVVSSCGPTDLTSAAFIEQNQLGDTAALIGLMNCLTGVTITAAEYQNKNGRYAEWINALQACSPLYQVRSGSAPTVLGHGKKDNIVPFDTATAMDVALAEKSVPHDFVIFPNSGHDLDQDPACSTQMYQLLVQYAQTYLK